MAHCLMAGISFATLTLTSVRAKNEVAARGTPVTGSKLSRAARRQVTKSPFAIPTYLHTLSLQ